jgi:hypothetical protein
VRQGCPSRTLFIVQIRILKNKLNEQRNFIVTEVNKLWNVCVIFLKKRGVISSKKRENVGQELSFSC